jgi:hypothetical protein
MHMVDIEAAGCHGIPVGIGLQGRLPRQSAFFADETTCGSV